MIPLLLFKKNIGNDRRLTFIDIGNKLSVRINSVHLILTDELDMKKVTSKLVIKFLTEDQMENHTKMYLKLKKNISNDSNFIKSIITDDKSWAFWYDFNTSSIIVIKVQKFTSSKKVQKLLKSKFYTKRPNLCLWLISDNNLNCILHYRKLSLVYLYIPILQITINIFL